MRLSYYPEHPFPSSWTKLIVAVRSLTRQTDDEFLHESQKLIKSFELSLYTNEYLYEVPIAPAAIEPWFTAPSRLEYWSYQVGFEAHNFLQTPALSEIDYRLTYISRRLRGWRIADKLCLSSFFRCSGIGDKCQHSQVSAFLSSKRMRATWPWQRFCGNMCEILLLFSRIWSHCTAAAATCMAFVLHTCCIIPPKSSQPESHSGTKAEARGCGSGESQPCGSLCFFPIRQQT